MLHTLLHTRIANIIGLVKKLVTFSILPVGVPIVLVAMISHSSNGATPPTVLASPVVITAAVAALPAQENLVPATPSPSPAELKFQHLRDFTLDTMMGWPKGARDLPVADVTDIANDIAAAVSSEPTAVELTTGKSCYTIRGSDRCFWQPEWNTDGAKAVLMAALAYYEGSRFAGYVDTNLCTDKTWRKSENSKRTMHMGGDCDGGAAHSLWQIHPFQLPNSKHYPICAKDVVDGSRFNAARCALELARQSMVNRNNLSGYTGEDMYIHPKADDRLNWARDSLRKHPYHELLSQP